MDDFEYYFFETSPKNEYEYEHDLYDDSWIEDACAVVDLQFNNCKFSFKNNSSVNIG